MSSYTVVDNVGYWYDDNGNYATDTEVLGVDPYTMDQVSLPSVGNWEEMLKAGIGALSAFQLNQINLERAKRGQPPINAAAYGPQVGIGLNQQTMNFLLYGALGISALFLITRKRS